MPERTIICDRQGEEIGRIHGEKRSIVPLNQVAENFRKAILARENERFYNHGAIDPIGIVRARHEEPPGEEGRRIHHHPAARVGYFRAQDPSG